ncbi:MAG TPA: hypothetical protein VJ020_07885 [Anaerolineales bacterium]|nr:hypothetical protein [Anaerolineales bacterium]
MAVDFVKSQYPKSVVSEVEPSHISNDSKTVFANDPLVGKVAIPIDEFNESWQANGAAGVVVAPKPIPAMCVRAKRPEPTTPHGVSVGLGGTISHELASPEVTGESRATS